MDTQLLVMVVGGFTAATNAIFWGAFLLGKIQSRIERLEVKVEDHEGRFRRLDFRK